MCPLCLTRTTAMPPTHHVRPGPQLTDDLVTTIKFPYAIDENPHVVNFATYNSMGSTFRLIELRELGCSGYRVVSTFVVPVVAFCVSVGWGSLQSVRFFLSLSLWIRILHYYVHGRRKVGRRGLLFLNG